MKKQIIIASRYHVIRKIGEGGMAKVYLAYDNVQEINVALKVLRKENVQEKKIKHFKREANALSLMDDDNIVKIYDVGEEGDIHYIVNEYVEGMTLKEYIATCSPLPIEEVIELTRQTLLGLEHAHKRGVVHKDIKSQNILLNENKDVKITDFGIANIMDDDMTKTQSVMGTPQYVAPEILNREELTAQSDIYSVGILMYEMLVGTAPFTGEKPAVIMIKQMNHPLPSIRDERADCPQSLENIVIKAAAKTLNNRYKACEDMLYDLDTVLEAERINEKKLLLKDDLLSQEYLEKSVSINDDLNYNNLKESSDNAQKKKKQKRIIMFITIPILLLIIAGVLYQTNKPLLMPELVGQDAQTAKDQLVFNGINPDNITIDNQESDTVEKGKIISTEPVAGEKYSSDTPIVLTVSSGKKQVVMQDYSNQLYEQVNQELTAAGFIVQANYVDSSYSSGVIIAQDPESGTNLEEGQTITFDVSTGINKVTVDNFTNMTESEVATWSKDNQVAIKKVYACNDTFDKGRVYDQSPSYNTEITTEDTITVNVSSGACPSSDTTASDTTTSDTTPASTSTGTTNA